MKEEIGGFFQRLLGRSKDDDSSAVSRTLDLEDIQGIILRGYRMPVVRHFLLKVDVPAAARRLLGRLVNDNETDAPQITRAKDWHVGFEPGPGDDPAASPRCKPEYCLNLGITWPGLSRSRFGIASLTSPSNRSAHSSPVPQHGRNGSVTRARMGRRTGSAVSEPEATTSC